MISLRISASVFVEGATSEEEARAAVMERAGATEISYVSRTGPDESPVYTVKLKDEVLSPEEEDAEEVEIDEAALKLEIDSAEVEPGSESEPTPEEFKEVTE